MTKYTKNMEGRLMREFTKTSKPTKATTTRKTTWTSTTTRAASTNATTMKTNIMVFITTRNTGKSMPSMKNQVNTQKDTAQRAVTTSTKRTNMRRKWNSSRKKEIPSTTRATVVTTAKKNIHRATTLRRATRKPVTLVTRRAKQAISGKGLMDIIIRATSSPQATTLTASMVRPTTRVVVATAAGSGSTTTGIPQRLRT